MYTQGHIEDRLCEYVEFFHSCPHYKIWEHAIFHFCDDAYFSSLWCRPFFFCPCHQINPLLNAMYCYQSITMKQLIKNLMYLIAI